MGQVLHGSATTTEAVRRAIQRSQESVRALARRHGVSPTTVQKWRKRQTTADLAMGPKEARSTALTPEQEAVVVAFRRHTLLPLDDCLYALQPSIPALTRSGLHRCFRRHGISRLPGAEGEGAGKKRFKAYPIGYFHLDIAEVRTEAGKLHLFVAIDRTSKFAFARLHERATRRVAADFLHALVEAVPYRIHTVLTDNGTQFTDTLPVDDDPETEAAVDALWAARGRAAPLARPRLRPRVREARHRAPADQALPPWTNGQVERMNRTLKDALRQALPLREPDDCASHRASFSLDAYNTARLPVRPCAASTPSKFSAAWTKKPERFNARPVTPHPVTEQIGNEHRRVCSIRADADSNYAAGRDPVEKRWPASRVVYVRGRPAVTVQPGLDERLYPSVAA
jgi:transposase